MRRLTFLLFLPLSAGCGGGATVSIPEPAVLQKLPPGTHQREVTVPGVGAVKYSVEVPANYDGQTPVPLVVVLHYGYDGAKPDPYTGKEMIEAFRPGLAGLNAIVIAPDALGGDWTSAQNEQAVVWLTRSAMKTYAIDPKRVVLTGFSMGGAGTWFIGSRHQDLFTGAIPVAAPVADGDAGWRIPVYVIHSDKDQIVSYSAARQHADAVKAKGAKVEFKTVSGLSHYQTGAYGRYVGDAVQWLQTEWK
jgi:predicted peptidase